MILEICDRCGAEKGFGDPCACDAEAQGFNARMIEDAREEDYDTNRQTEGRTP